METILYPFLLYYWFFGLLLPFWQWVIVTGIVLVSFAKANSDWLKSKLSTLRTSVWWIGFITAIASVFGTMLTSFIYGAVAGEAGANLGKFIDQTVGSPWPIFRMLAGLFSGGVAVVALTGWALLIWCIPGVILASGVKMGARFFKRNR